MLRLAEPLDPYESRTRIPILDELMEWATTVVRIPLLKGYDDLASDIGSSRPSSCSSPRTRRSSGSRTATPASDASFASPRSTSERSPRRRRHTLDLARRSRRSIDPARERSEDAGELAHRDAISVWWAVPMQGRAAVGRFWAFFPTEDRTTLSGIVNAPWKMGDDRRNLCRGVSTRRC